MRTETLPYGSKKKLYALPNNMNRPVTTAHVNELSNSITKFNDLRDVIVIEVDFLEDEKRTYIVDGQHHYDALAKLGKPCTLRYVSGIKTIEDVVYLVAMLNNTSKKWKLEDYVNAWCECPATKSVYRLMRKYKKETSLGYTLIGMAFSPNTTSQSTKMIKAGQMKIPNRATTETLISNIGDLLKILNTAYPSEIRVLVTSYISFYMKNETTYAHNKFMNLLRQHKSHINQYMHSNTACEAFFDEVRKGGKLSNIIIAQRAGSPKANIGG